MTGIRRTLGQRLPLGNGVDANKVTLAICWIACANNSKPSSPSWRIFVWILTIIWPREIFGWSRSSKKSPAASGAKLSLTPLHAFAAICPRCANKVCLCCRLCKPPFVVIPSFLHSSGPEQLHRKYDSDRSVRFTRKSRRLSTHNYEWSGMYFITIRVREREPLLERPELRAIVERTWYALPDRYPGLALDEFVIMPDHVHFIVRLEGNVEKPVTLGRVVGAFKSIVTVEWLRYIDAHGLNCMGRFWQENFFDKVVRDVDQLEAYRKYIRENPARWAAKRKTP